MLGQGQETTQSSNTKLSNLSEVRQSKGKGLRQNVSQPLEETSKSKRTIKTTIKRTQPVRAKPEEKEAQIKPQEEENV